MCRTLISVTFGEPLPDNKGLKAGPLLIVAGAGTGKTDTLAHRVAHLVGNQARGDVGRAAGRKGNDQPHRTGGIDVGMRWIGEKTRERGEPECDDASREFLEQRDTHGCKINGRIVVLGSFPRQRDCRHSINPAKEISRVGNLVLGRVLIKRVGRCARLCPLFLPRQTFSKHNRHVC